MHQQSPCPRFQWNKKIFHDFFGNFANFSRIPKTILERWFPPPIPVWDLSPFISLLDSDFVKFFRNFSLFKDSRLLFISLIKVSISDFCVFFAFFKIALHCPSLGLEKVKIYLFDEQHSDTLWTKSTILIRLQLRLNMLSYLSWWRLEVLILIQCLRQVKSWNLKFL